MPGVIHASNRALTETYDWNGQFMTDATAKRQDRRAAPARPASRAGGDRRVLFIRSMPTERDSRSQKMTAEYRNHGFSVTKLIWTRGDAVPHGDDIIPFRKAGGYGVKFGNLLGFILWHLFICWTTIKRRKSIDLIHVVDFDTAVVGVPLGRILRKPIVYDASDHFASGFPENSWQRRLLAGFERWLIGRADVAMFPDPVRLIQYGVERIDHACIVGNIPDDAPIPLPSKDGAPETSRPLTLVYIGSLEAGRRGLEYIPRLCEDHPTRIAFVVGGFGRLTDFFQQSAARLDNLKFLGPQSYPNALQIMAGADCLYGPYLLTFQSHLYAAPNKMYEHLLLGQPLITSAGTPPASFVERHGTGFLFDGSYEALDRLIASLDRRECAERGARARLLWVTEYSGLRQRQIAGFFAALNAKLAPVEATAGGAR